MTVMTILTYVNKCYFCKLQLGKINGFFIS